MAISEQIELLGKGLYTDIPDVLTLSSIPTASELDYVASEDFDATMLETILPMAVKEQINFKHLLEIDYHWVCRCLRILNYGPYHTVNTILCGNCGQASYGEFQVDLQSIECKPLPPKFVNDMVISRDEFLDFEGDIHIKLPTIQDMLNARKDAAFKTSDGRSSNSDLARMCYMITSIRGNKMLTPIDKKMVIQKELSSADYMILKERISELTNYGLRLGGATQCPKCKSMKGTFMAFVDDRFFRPTLDNLTTWRNDRRKRKADDGASGKKATV